MRTWAFDRLAVAWVVLRLPIAAWLVWRFRAQVVASIERAGLLELVAESAIWILGTVATRVILFLAVTSLLTGVAVVASRRVLGRASGFALPLVATLLAVSAATRMPAATRIGLAVATALLSWVNSVPDSTWIGIAASTATKRISTAVVCGFPGLVEALAWKGVALWTATKLDASKIRGLGRATHLVTVAPVALLVAALADGRHLATAERWIRHDPAVFHFSVKNYGDLALDPERRTLFAVGHGIPRVEAFDLDHPGRRPRLSTPSIEPAEFLWYSAQWREVYVYQRRTSSLATLDAETLAVKSMSRLPRLNTGDTGVFHVPVLDAIVVISESDVHDGVPFVAIDRASGRLLEQTDIDASGDALVHPGKPWLYLTFFRGRSEILLYDLAEHRIRASAPSDPRSFQMAYWPRPEGDEVLVAAPVVGIAERFEAGTLKPKGVIQTQVNGRSLAIDRQHQLLLSGSMGTGRLVVIDLATQRRLSSTYVSPWIRAIRLDERTGTAFVSSPEGLFRVRYLEDSARPNRESR